MWYFPVHFDANSSIGNMSLNPMSVVRSDISIIHINKWLMHIVFVYIYYLVSIVL